MKKIEHRPIAIVTIIAGSLGVVASGMSLVSGVLLLTKRRQS